MSAEVPHITVCRVVTLVIVRCDLCGRPHRICVVNAVTALCIG